MIVPQEIYVLNVLLFSSLPERVSIVQLKEPLTNRPASVSLDEAGTFIHREEELWSFVPLPIFTDILGSIADVATSRDLARSDIKSDPDQRRVLSWLLRKRFRRHLSRFMPHGLILEEGRKKGRRAYFDGRGGKGRKLVYDTPRRKAVSREVVKQRGDAPRAWFENEGFGYEITQLDGIWAVHIKPFYMFTGRDARSPCLLLLAPRAPRAA